MRPKNSVETVERVELVELSEFELSSLCVRDRGNVPEFELSSLCVRLTFIGAAGICCIRPLKHVTAGIVVMSVCVLNKLSVR